MRAISSSLVLGALPAIKAQGEGERLFNVIQCGGREAQFFGAWREAIG
jgi:hypothetical protein